MRGFARAFARDDSTRFDVPMTDGFEDIDAEIVSRSVFNLPSPLSNILKYYPFISLKPLVRAGVK